MSQTPSPNFIQIPGKVDSVFKYTPTQGLGLTLLVGILSLGVPQLSVAQTLNEALKIQLDGDCAAIRGGAPSPLGIPGLSSALNSICVDNDSDATSGAGVLSSGNGTALIQRVTISVNNRRKARLGKFQGGSIPSLKKMAISPLGGGEISFSIQGSNQQPTASPQSPGTDSGGSSGPSSPQGSSPSAPGGSISSLVLMNDQFVKDLSFFISTNIESIGRDTTQFAGGFNSTLVGGTFGGDYQWNDRFLMGSAFTFTRTNGDFDGGGNFDSNSYEVTVYGAWVPIPQTFLDIAFGFVSTDHSVNRPVTFTETGDGIGNVVTLSGIAGSDSDGREFSVHMLSGYDFIRGPVTIGPRVGINFTNLHIDSYSETGGGGLALIFDEQNANSFQSMLGLQGSMAVATSYGVWAPQATADFVHEFANNQQFVTVRFAGDGRATPTKFKFQTDKPVRNFFNLGVGTVLILPHGIQPYVNFRAMLGNEHFTNFAGTIGVRVEMAEAFALF